MISRNMNQGKLGWIFSCLLALLLLAILGGAEHAFARTFTPQAQIFLLPHEKCTATIFRPDERSCALVTNAHCLKAGAKTALLAERYHPLPSISLFRPGVPKNFDQQVLHTVNVKKISREMDLAELSIPPEIEQFFCSDSGLKTWIPLDSRDVFTSHIGLISTGYVNGDPFYTMSGLSYTGISNRGQLFWPDVGVSRREAYPTQIKELPEVVKVHDLNIREGMSGGAILNQYSRFEGINLWVRNNGIHQSFFIPTQAVIDFLKHDLPAMAPTIPNTIDQKIAPVGGNGHANGTGRGKKAIGDTYRNLMDFFFAPEGIIDPNNKDQIILGINGESVDGEDDYRRLSATLISSIVTKENKDKSFPSKEVRENFWNRLAGTYTTETSGGRSYVYSRSTVREPLEIEHYKIGTPNIRIQIDPKANTLSISIPSHILQNRVGTDDLRMDQIPQFAANFELAMVNDGQLIVLIEKSSIPEERKIRFICENNQFLKLNCLSQNLSFSLHQYGKNRLEAVLNIYSSSRYSLINFFGDLHKIEGPGL